MPDSQFPIQRDLARAGLYRLLALGFRYPDPGGLAEFERVQALFREGDWLFPAIDPGLIDVPVSPAADLEGEYLRLFDHKVECSPYESEYGMGNKSFTKSRDLADIAGFYRAFGLDLGEKTNDLYDHVAVELEFMGVLALKAAYARADHLDDGLTVTHDAEVSFLREHLGRWAPHFAGRLTEATAEPYYQGLAALLSALLRSELELFNVEPLPLARAIKGFVEEEPEDAMTCPMAN